MFCKSAENIWSHATFDAAIVINHNKILNITPTYRYWAMKDLRTLQILAGMSRHEMNAYKATAKGPLHDAITDCKVQIDWASDALNRIGK